MAPRRDRLVVAGGVAAVVKVSDLEVARTGLNLAEAAVAGFQPVAATIEQRSRAGYYPGAVPITVRLVLDRRAGRVLGAQLFGWSRSRPSRRMAPPRGVSARPEPPGNWAGPRSATSGTPWRKRSSTSEPGSLPAPEPPLAHR